MNSPALKKHTSTATPPERLAGVTSASSTQSATLSREQQLLRLQGQAENQADTVLLRSENAPDVKAPETRIGTQLLRMHGQGAYFLASSDLASLSQPEQHQLLNARGVSRSIGGTETNLEIVFTTVAGTILFYANADVAFGGPSQANAKHTRYAIHGISYLVQKKGDDHICNPILLEQA